MKIRKLILSTFILILSIILLSGCKRPPDQVIKNVKLISYSKDGISYSREINAFSFFDQFRETDVMLDFTSKDFTLICFDKRYTGRWEEVEESKVYGSNKGTTYFTIKDKNGNTGTGYSGAFGFDGLVYELGLTYLTYSFEFNERGNEIINDEYSLENELKREAELLNESLNSYDTYFERNNEAYYYTPYSYYEVGEIEKINNAFYFKNGNSSVALKLDNGFFYDFNNLEEIEYSENIRQGRCIYKYNYTTKYYAIFYIE